MASNSTCCISMVDARGGAGSALGFHPTERDVDPEPMGSMDMVALPYPAMECVLQQLPAKARARLQAVCKRWRLPGRFARLLKRSAGITLACEAPLRCTLVSWTTRSAGDADPKSNLLRFRHLHTASALDLSFLPARFRRWQRDAVWYASQCGVIVVRDKSWNHQAELSLCAINLANQSWKVLPPLGFTRPGTMDVQVVAEAINSGTSVHVIVVWNTGTTGPGRHDGDGDGDGDTSVAVYSSVNMAWKLVLTDCHGRYHLDAVCKGVLHLMQRPSVPDGVATAMRLGLLDGKQPGKLVLPFVGFRAGGACRLARQHYMVAQGCTLFLVTTGCSRTVICELRMVEGDDGGSRQWVEVAVSPAATGLAGGCKNKTLESVQVAGDVIFIRLSSKSPESRTYVIAYNVVLKLWRKISKEATDQRISCSIVEWRPDLDLKFL